MHQPYVVRQFVPRERFLAGLGAQGVDLEVMAGEPAHEPVAPRVRLTGRIWITTFGEQSNTHECTTVLPYRRPWCASDTAATCGKKLCKGPVARWTVVHRATGRGEHT
ncbi:hypothetical protein GCM10010416_13240 [Streptomyces caniferus]